MKFVITKHNHAEADSFFLWKLQKGDEDVVCASADIFKDEAAARSDIAKAKVAMKAARFAKVESA